MGDVLIYDSTERSPELRHELPIGIGDPFLYIEREGVRPVGGMEMGGKALYCRQSTIRLRKDDGEITDVALDEWTKVEPV